MSADRGEVAETNNSIDGGVSGAAVQARTVNGGVHILNGMREAFSSRDTLEKLMTDLESVHRDYLVMFESVLAVTPLAMEQDAPDFTKRIAAAAAMLRQLRLAYEPVRVRVRAVAQVFAEAELTEPERDFAKAVFKYFPTGELFKDPTPYSRTSGTAVLDHFYRSLDGELSLDLHRLVDRTVKLHRERWESVCAAYALLLKP